MSINTSYSKKLAELTARIEEKAKELGKISGLVEELTKQRAQLGQSITKIELEIKQKNLELYDIQARVSAERRQIGKDAEPRKEKVKTLEQWVHYLTSVVDARKIDLENVEEVKKSILDLQERRNEENQKYQEAVVKTEEALRVFNAKLEESKAFDEDKEKARLEIQSTKEALQKVRENLDQWYNELKFYARRLYKFYVEKGVAFPQELLEGFYPLKYFPSRDLQEKLRLKKLVKQRYG